MSDRTTNKVSQSEEAFADTRAGISESVGGCAIAPPPTVKTTI
ncbi:hypothetical protein [Nostoc sp. CALU 546]